MIKAGKYFIPYDPYFEGVFQTGEFEHQNLNAALEACRSFRTAIDGGAHVGSWTWKIASKFEKVLAFEPNKDNYECLLLNASMPNVTHINAALGESHDIASLVKGTNSGSGYITPGNDFKVFPLDHYNLTDVDFIKLDVEGFEPFALRGAIKTIESSWPVILVEQKPLTARYRLDYKEAGRFLEELGYKLVTQVNNDYIYRK